MVELIARIENIKRHFHIDIVEQYELSQSISYDVSSHTLTVAKEEHKLSKKEAEILHYFIQHKSEVISQEDLIINLWSYEEAPTSATIRSYIKNLRKLLGSEAIENIRGVGYRFN